MAKVIVGVFDEYDNAQNVQQELLSIGLPSSNIEISSARGGVPYDSNVSNTASPQTDDDSLMGRIKHFFSTLVDDEDEQRSTYSHRYLEAVRRGSTVVTVQATDEDQIDRIEEVMERHDAIDIDERASNWQGRGWNAYDDQAPLLSEVELEQERQYYRSPLASPASIGSASSLAASAAVPRATNATNATNATHATSGTSADMPSSASSSAPFDASAARGASDRQANPLIHDQPRADTREGSRGRVRVFTRVREAPEQAQLQPREEHASTERRPVYDAVRSTEADIDDDADIHDVTDAEADFEDESLVANPNRPNSDRPGTRRGM